MQITIPNEEVKALIWAAGDRVMFKRIHGLIDTKKVDQKRLDIELVYEGLLGEWAVAKALELSMNLEIYLCGDGGRDFTYYGYTMDVKTTQAKYLLFKSMKDFTADIAVLVKRLDLQTLDIEGIISRKKFAQIHEMKNFGYAYTCAVSPEKLSPIEEFKTYARNHPKH